MYGEVKQYALEFKMHAWRVVHRPSYTTYNITETITTMGQNVPERPFPGVSIVYWPLWPQVQVLCTFHAPLRSESLCTYRTDFRIMVDEIGRWLKCYKDSWIRISFSHVSHFSPENAPVGGYYLQHVLHYFRQYHLVYCNIHFITSGATIVTIPISKYPWRGTRLAIIVRIYMTS